jgi:hypothetical protein
LVGVGGLHLLKVLKTRLTFFPSIIYVYGDLRLWDEAVHDVKSAVQEKDEPVPKLPVEKLRISSEKWNRLKGEKAL